MTMMPTSGNRKCKAAWRMGFWDRRSGAERRAMGVMHRSLQHYYDEGWSAALANPGVVHEDCFTEETAVYQAIDIALSCIPVGQTNRREVQQLLDALSPHWYAARQRIESNQRCLGSLPTVFRWPIDRGYDLLLVTGRPPAALAGGMGVPGGPSFAGLAPEVEAQFRTAMENGGEWKGQEG
jgi:hypothetical protein